MHLAITSPPSIEPVTREEVKANARILQSDQDALLDARIIAARMHTEDVIGRALVTRTFVMTLPGFPSDGRIVLPRPPALAVSSVAYLAPDGATMTFDSVGYVVGRDAGSAWLDLMPGAAWPATAEHPAAVTVTWTAGYGPGAADVPEPIRLAMILLVGHWHANREASGERGGTVPYGYEALLGPYRTHGWI